MSQYQPQAYLSADGRMLMICIVDPATGIVYKQFPLINLKLDDAKFATQDKQGDQIAAVLRRVHFVDTSGNKKRCYGFFTIPEDDTVDDGNSNVGDGDPLVTAGKLYQDVVIGGGGGGWMMCIITALYGQNYFQVQHLVAGAATGDPFLVAKSIPSRMDGSKGTDEFTYASGSFPVGTFATTDNARTINGTSPLVYEFMTDPFNAGDAVFVATADGTGVNGPDSGGPTGDNPTGGADLKFIEANTQREWAEPLTPAS